LQNKKARDGWHRGPWELDRVAFYTELLHEARDAARQQQQQQHMSTMPARRHTELRRRLVASADDSAFAAILVRAFIGQPCAP
jgi:hypothetical protein